MIPQTESVAAIAAIVNIRSPTFSSVGSSAAAVQRHACFGTRLAAGHKVEIDLDHSSSRRHCIIDKGMSIQL